MAKEIWRTTSNTVRILIKVSLYSSRKDHAPNAIRKHPTIFTKKKKNKFRYQIENQITQKMRLKKKRKYFTQGDMNVKFSS